MQRFAGGGVVHVPLLCVRVEANVRGPDDLESPEHTEINHFCEEAVDETARIEAKDGVHPSPPSCWWLFWRVDCRQKSGLRVRSRGFPSASSMALVAASQPLP